MLDHILMGAYAIYYADNEKHDLQLVYMPATYHLDPCWEGIKRHDLPQFELQAQMGRVNQSIKPSHDILSCIQVLPKYQKWMRKRKGKRKRKRKRKRKANGGCRLVVKSFSSRGV